MLELTEFTRLEFIHPDDLLSGRAQVHQSFITGQVFTHFPELGLVFVCRHFLFQVRHTKPRSYYTAHIVAVAPYVRNRAGTSQGPAFEQERL